MMQNSAHIFEFHISNQSRQRYDFDQSIFSYNGNVIFANFHAARLFAQKMNEQRDLLRYPDQAVKAGQLIAMGLIDEILHHVIDQYRRQRNPDAIVKALTWLENSIGAEELDKALLQFVQEFPPMPVYQGQLTVEEYFTSNTNGISNRQITLEEMLMLWIANANPAFGPYIELFDDSNLEYLTTYPVIIAELDAFFNTQPTFGPENQTLIQMLRAPALASPDSLSSQLEFLRTRWGALLGSFLRQLLSSLDLIKEEEKPVFFGPGPAQVLEFDTSPYLFEEERFSPDSHWMPRLVLLAKNAYVWLDQLSKEYGRPIHKLDQVPDKELDRLSMSGFTGMWLIGLWERSPASQKIKQRCGNPEAVPSAYSLYDYVIANDLGGEDAYENLRHRAWQRGVRLAADMVPNHVGIYSKWVIENPDWFISLDYSPFPTYTFYGDNLSDDQRVGIYLEDHYYSREDAAVVFKRVDQWTGDTKYVYHGNDGTSMPWNDTAQLNFLNAEVREAVIQTILHVARKFPVIRFDAAMTLAKKHFQRLWFPQPGTGGDIPTRAEFGLTREQFDAAMPVEFWREVVDRVAEEVPDTLLLAEAFWMMEGYFVRTLGMHRVYNSAFMNMLRDEKNDEYRQLIKNTLEFDPQILKRYVNFMNNPDEETAIEQFGKDGKYFGICTLMATLPGLPMFGHGQIEGYYEKYGMEYRRAYWDEYPDTSLVNRHQREIFPLLHKRYLFAEVDSFLLFDFYTPEGQVNENVFAYSNSSGYENCLVIYHNRWADTKGWIKTSAAYLQKNQDDGELVQRDIAEGMSLQNDDQIYTIFQDHFTGLEYIRNNREIFERGLYFELAAYKYHVFLDFHQVLDNEWGQYAQLHHHLQGRGVPSIEESIKEIFLQPIRYPFSELVNPGMYQWLLENLPLSGQDDTGQHQSVLSEARQKMGHLIREINQLIGCDANDEALADKTCDQLNAVLQLPNVAEGLPKKAQHLIAPKEDPTYWGTIFSWLFTNNLGEIFCDEQDTVEQSRNLIDEWLLGKIIAQTMDEFKPSPQGGVESVQLLKILISHQNWYKGLAPKKKNAALALKSWLKDPELQEYLRINRYEGVLWFNKEAFDELTRCLLAIALIKTFTDSKLSDKKISSRTKGCYKIIHHIRKASKESGFQVEKLLELVNNNSVKDDGS
jgi:glycosidase